MSEQPKSETIRQWYQRTTRRARKAILYATIASAIVMAFSWYHTSMPTMIRIQTFNGALTVPLLALVWTAALVFMFLRPTREAAFRSQESMDSGIKSLEGRVEAGIEALDKRMDTVTKMFSEAINNKIVPAMDCWNRVGQRIEKVVVDGLFDELKMAIREIKDSAASLEKSAAEGNGEIKKFVADSRPAIEALKRIHNKVDKELGEGFVEDLKSAMQSVRELGGMPSVVPPPVQAPQVTPAPAPPQITRRPKPAEAAPAPVVPQVVVLPQEPIPVIETPVVDSTPAFVDTSHPVVIEKLQPAAPPVSHEPDLERALRVISKKKAPPQSVAAVDRQ